MNSGIFKKIEEKTAQAFYRRNVMRVLSKEYQEHLKNNEIYQFIINHPRPDFAELDKECDDFEVWISSEHKKEREQLKEISKQ